MLAQLFLILLYISDGQREALPILKSKVKTLLLSIDGFQGLVPEVSLHLLYLQRAERAFLFLLLQFDLQHFDQVLLLLDLVFLLIDHILMLFSFSFDLLFELLHLSLQSFQLLVCYRVQHSLIIELHFLHFDMIVNCFFHLFELLPKSDNVLMLCH
jgi:hypothetical protein